MKRLSLLLLTCFITSFVFAGEGIGIETNYAKKKGGGKFDKSRLFVGGGLGGGSLISGGFFISASPTVGYQFTDRFHAGISLGGTFFRNKYYESNFLTGASEKYVESGMHYSPSIFARYFLLDVLFLQAMPELNSFKGYDYNSATPNYTTGRYDIDPFRVNTASFLVGAGYAQRMGGNSYMMITLMYDLVQNPNSPYYRRPIFGGGLALGLFGGR